MTWRRIAMNGILCALAMVAVTKASAANAGDDPYAPLRLYDGAWEATMASAPKDTVRLENHCAKTGLFFVCEQVVAGKTGALLVFAPVAKLPGGGEEYHTKALPPSGIPAGDWGKLTIDGDRWTYSWEDEENGKKTYWRNVNVFTGSDAIHFELQNSTDGVTWKTQNSGDERRVKAAPQP